MWKYLGKTFLWQYSTCKNNSDRTITTHTMTKIKLDSATYHSFKLVIDIKY